MEAVDVHGNARVAGPYALELQEQPIADLVASNDGPRLPGELVTLTASISAGSNVRYAWDLGDGATGEGPVVEHAYAEAGEYTATVTATNSLGAVQATTTVIVAHPLDVQGGDDPSVQEGDLVALLYTFLAGTSGAHQAYIEWGDGGDAEAGLVDETLGTVSRSHAYADDGLCDVTVTVTDNLGGSATDALLVTVSNAPPTAEAGEERTIAMLETLPLAPAALADPGAADTHTATIDWDDDSEVDEGLVDGAALTVSGDRAYQTPGDYTVTVTVTDDDGGAGSDAFTLHVTKRATTLVYTGVTEGQCSDMLTLSALLTDTASVAPLVGRTISFTLGSQSATAITDDTGAPTASLTLAQPAGAYTIDASFAEEDAYEAASVSSGLTILPEDARVRFHGSNPVAVSVAKAGDKSGAFGSEVAVREAGVRRGSDLEPNGERGGEPGNIDLARVQVRLVPVGPGGEVAPVSRSAAVYDSGYDARLSVRCGFAEVPVNTYVVQVTVNGDYYGGSGEDVLTVYDPSLGYTTGAAEFLWPGTDEVTRVGYTMKYNKKGTNLQGSLLLVRHSADGETLLYQVKSNALYGLALGEGLDQDSGESFGWATFSGKCTYREPGWPEPVGNHEFTVYVEDRGEPDSGLDRFWIEVTNGLALPREAADEAIAIEGGDLFAPHGVGPRR